MELVFQRKEKIVGAFVVLMIVALMALVVLIGRARHWFETYVTYYTVFDQTYNLSKDSRVKLYTVDVGKVTGVKLVGDKVKVELAILKDYAGRIKTDSVATVESPTFIGSEYVSIKPGTAKALPIPVNGTIPSRPKKSLADLMAEFEVEKTLKMVIKSIQDISETVKHLRDPKGPLYSALDSAAGILANIEAITRDIRQGKGSLGKLVGSEEALQKVYAQLDHVNSILKNIERATNTAREIAGNIESASAKSPEMVAGLRKALDMINQILTNIEQGSRDVPTVTKTTRQGIREIRDGVEEANKVIESLQKNFLIRPGLPPEPKGKNIQTRLRR